MKNPRAAQRSTENTCYGAAMFGIERNNFARQTNGNAER